MWSSNQFFCIQLFPTFFGAQVFASSRFLEVQILLGPYSSGFNFLWVQVFQGPDPGSGSSFQNQLTGKLSYAWKKRFSYNLNPFCIISSWKKHDSFYSSSNYSIYRIYQRPFNFPNVTQSLPVLIDFSSLPVCQVVLLVMPVACLEIISDSSLFQNAFF